MEENGFVGGVENLAIVLLAAAQRLLGSLRLGEVDVNTEHLRLPAGPLDHCMTGKDCHPGPVFSLERQLGGWHGLERLGHLIHSKLHLMAHIGGHDEVQQVAADGFLGGVAVKTFRSGVPVRHFAVGRIAANSHRGNILKQRMKAAFAFPQGGFPRLLLAKAFKLIKRVGKPIAELFKQLDFTIAKVSALGRAKAEHPTHPALKPKWKGSTGSEPKFSGDRFGLKKTGPMATALANKGLVINAHQRQELRGFAKVCHRHKGATG